MKLKAVKFISFLCVLACLSSTVIPSVLALDTTTPSSGTITPFYKLTQTTRCSLSISSNGHVQIIASVTASSSVKSCSGTVKLQKKLGSSWYDVCSWSVSANGHSMSTIKTADVVKGTYRAVFTVTVKTSSSSETTTTYSGSSTY